ncbi:ABHD14A [Bugula neritina]|uniref:ABHD14A n=1 Tax=Bugula neritina TaxID=10212 RepID=A0A7J7JJ59_BUGNE|nr:ABHD14A [Bugula neritina]
MSGTFSVPYVTCGRYDDEIVGYIPVAPVIHSSYSEDNFKKLKLKALIVQGENDKLPVASRSMKLLQNIPNSNVVIIAEAGHPCYLNQPIVWHQHLRTSCLLCSLGLGLL